MAVENPKEYLGYLDKGLFLSDTAKSLFTAIDSLYKDEAQLNARNIAAEIGAKEESLNGFFSQSLPTEGDFGHWKSQLSVEKAKRDIQNSVLNGVLPTASSKEGSEFDISKTEELLNTIQDNLELVKGKDNLLYSAPDLMDRYDDVILERSAGIHYYDTGCYHLNSSLTEGFAPSRITTLFGSSGVGKSSYALYLVNRQINKQIPSLYISLEMDAVVTMDRLIAQRNRLPLSELIPSGGGGVSEMDDYHYEYIDSLLERERKKLGQSKYFHFIEEPGISLDDVEYYIRYIQRKTKRQYMIVTIDLMTMLREFSGDNKASVYEDAMNKVHEVAKRTGVHIVGVVQSRRPSEKVKIETADDVSKLRPQIEEIKNSGAFEERSRAIISTFRKKFFVERLIPDAPELQFMSDLMEVRVLKQNIGGLPLRYYVYEAPSALLTPLPWDKPGEDPYMAGAANI